MTRKVASSVNAISSQFRVEKWSLHNSPCCFDSNLVLCKCIRHFWATLEQNYLPILVEQETFQVKCTKIKNVTIKSDQTLILKTGMNSHWFVCGNVQMYLSPKCKVFNEVHYSKWITSNAIEMQNAFVLWYTAAAAATATANVARWVIIVEKALIMLKAVYSRQDLQMADLIRGIILLECEIPNVYYIHHYCILQIHSLYVLNFVMICIGVHWPSHACMFWNALRLSEVNSPDKTNNSHFKAKFKRDNLWAQQINAKIRLYFL